MFCFELFLTITRLQFLHRSTAGKITNTICRTNNGDIVLFYHHDSPFIFARTKNPDGGWVQRSTKSNDKEEALKLAERWYREFQFLKEQGVPIQKHTFAYVAELYLDELEDDVRLQLRNPRHLKDYKPVAERFLITLFGRKTIAQIKNQDIADYQKWRAAYWIDGPGAEKSDITYVRNGKTIKRPKPKGRPPSTTTQNKELVVFRSIFKVAVKKDFIKEAQIPSIMMAQKIGNVRAIDVPPSRLRNLTS